MKAALDDRKTYGNLKFWMEFGDAKRSLAESFLIQKFYTKTIPLKVAETVTPFLK